LFHANIFRLEIAANITSVTELSDAKALIFRFMLILFLRSAIKRKFKLFQKHFGWANQLLGQYRLFNFRLVGFFPTSCSPHILLLTSDPACTKVTKHELLSSYTKYSNTWL